MKKFLLSALAILTMSGSGFAQNLPSYVPANGLVGWWPFNGNANDESGNGNHGTINGATLTADRFGNAGKAYYFDGNSKITLNQHFLDGAFSVVVWLKVTENQPGQHGLGTIFSNGIQHGNWGNGIQGGISELNNQIKFEKNAHQISGGFGFQNLQPIPFNDGSFHCIVYSWNGNSGPNSAFIHHNGDLIASSSSLSTLINSSRNLEIGIGTDGGATYPFKGILDDFIIYNRALTQQEITQLYQAGNSNSLTCGISASDSTLCAGQSATLTASATGGAGSATGLPANLQQGLVGYWPFNGNANDESGNGNNGTVNGATLTADRFGNEGKAFDFNGVSNNIYIPNSPNLNLQGSVTVSIWGKLSTQTTGVAIHLRNNSNNHETSIRSNAPFYFDMNNGISGASIAIPSINQTDLTWHNFVSVYNTITNKSDFYLDGIFQGSSNISITILGDSHFGFGSAVYQTFSNQYFHGTLDDIAIYNRALSAAEVQQLYNASTYAWSTGETTPSINVTPAQTTTYYCTVTNGNQTCTDSVTITVNQPTSGSISASISEGESYSFNGQLLTLAGVYTDTLVNAAGCDSLLTLTLTVNSTPLNCGIEASQSTLCAGQSATLTMGNGTTGISTENYVDDIDGNRYPTIQIGGKTWMAKNLRTTRFANGDPITYIEGNSDWANCVNTQVGAWCYVNNNPDTDSSLGKFYNWYAATDSRNVCPTGWHLSTESDWNKLVINLDANSDTISTTNGTIMSNIVGGKLKSTESGTWGPPNVGATDEIGFNAKGTNFRGAGGFNYYWPLIRAANYWVPNDFSETKAWVRTINYDEASIGLNLIGGNPVDNKSMGNSIRCVSNTINSLSTYLWSTGETTPSINVTPSQTTTYYCTVTNGNQTCTDSVTITVNQPTTGSITASINEGESYSFNGQLLTVAGTYKDTLVNAAGCDSLLTLTLTVTNPGPLAAPLITPATGTYSDPLSVSISSSSPGAQIYYTTSGNIPVVGTSFTRLYTGTFQVLESTTVRAIAVKSGLPASSVAVSFLTITNPGICAAPVITPASGTYGGSVTISMSTATPEGEIWYTTNGNNPRFDVPNSFTKRYLAPIVLYGNTPIKAITIKSGLVNSPIVSANYSITEPFIVATPTLSPLPGNFGASQSISLSTSTPDAQIYYTTNGNVPRIDIPNSFTRLYTGPFVLTQTTTVRAQAVRTGWLPSGIAVGVYTFGGARLALAGEGEMPHEGEVSVYPNPSSGGLFFMQMPVEATEAVPFSVLALDGKEVSSGFLSPGQPQRLDLGNMPAGLYQVKLQYPDRIKVLRLMK